MILCPPSAAKPLAISTNFSVKATNPLTITYYADGVHGYADVAIHLNITMNKGEYEMQVAEDGLLL
jgi:hypothetical protein